MKRCFILLILIFSAIYLTEGWLLMQTENNQQKTAKSSLSEIALEVTAIPLLSGNSINLQEASNFKRYADHLFLINKKQLLHFDNSGHFINAVTSNDPLSHKHLRVEDYIIDTNRKQLIILDQRNELHYYSFAGEKLDQKTFPQQPKALKIGKMEFYDNKIWSTIERIVEHTTINGIQKHLEQWLYCFDTNLKVLDSRKLDVAETTRSGLNYAINPEVAVANKQVYVQSSAIRPDHLLEDTLRLIDQNKLDITPQYQTILPLRINKRYLFASQFNRQDNDANYMFFYDCKKHCSIESKKGLTDDFFNTGRVLNLQAMDLTGDTYCFLKSGHSLQQSFPDRNTENDSVLFIVRLKS